MKYKAAYHVLKSLKLVLESQDMGLIKLALANRDYTSYFTRIPSMENEMFKLQQNLLEIYI